MAAVLSRITLGTVATVHKGNKGSSQTMLDHEHKVHSRRYGDHPLGLPCSGRVMLALQ